MKKTKKKKLCSIEIFTSNEESDKGMVKGLYWVEINAKPRITHYFFLLKGQFFGNHHS